MLVNARNSSWLPSVFNDLLEDEWLAKRKISNPAINVIEKEKEYAVEITAPGMSKEDFTLKVNENNGLEVTIKKKENVETTGDASVRYLRREFSYTEFQQTFVLPKDVDKDKITATAVNGILTISLPKLQPEDKANLSRVIEIH